MRGGKGCVRVKDASGMNDALEGETEARAGIRKKWIKKRRGKKRNLGVKNRKIGRGITDFFCIKKWLRLVFHRRGYANER